MIPEAVETLAARAVFGGLGRLPWRRSLAAGAALGALVGALGLRRRVAERNLALAFPEREPRERRRILDEHYRELGRVAAEYARLGELARSPAGEVVAEVRGLEHLEAARAGGRGAILMSGHFGNFELMGAWLVRYHPVDFVVQPLRNRALDRRLTLERRRAGVHLIPHGAGVRAVYSALRANRWVPMLADQDARRHGVFVPFLGRPASTPSGPARIALATGAPIVMGFATRGEDGRHTLEIEPPLVLADPGAPDAVQRLTALHTARLEAWVRRRPEGWFWLHRRWKTAPPCGAPPSAGVAGEGGPCTA